MPSTHLNLNYHLIFSTKDRRPIIQKAWRARLHAFVGGTLKTMDAMPIEIGGVEDHIHVLASLKATHCLAYVLRDIKAVSSGWVHDEGLDESFQWQEGYGGFTVSPSMIEEVRRYIQRQEEHHRKKTFQEEYVEMLEKTGTKFEPKFLW